MDSPLQQVLEAYLQQTPAPTGMTSREIVRKAIEFDNPPRIPYSFITPLASDFFETAAVPRFLELFDPESKGANLWTTGKNRKQRVRGEKYYDEWGVGWETTERFWDHAFDHPLQNLQKLKDYRFPGVAAPEKFDALQTFIEQAHKAGKYIVGFDPTLMFERMRALLGFEELMVAPYTQPAGLQALLDRLADLETDVIKQWARLGNVDAYMTWDDWGLQTTLQMNPETFRQYYKPRYARIVETAHRHGMHYIWHNCGYIMNMIEDMIEIGVDAVQLDQPRLMGHKELADRFGGRICFWNTVDIQWSTMGNPSKNEIKREVAEMIQAFNGFHGGFIARQYPDANDIGMSRERHMLIYEAFLENGCAL